MKVFKEEQRFRQTWFIIVLTISSILSVAIIVKEYLKVNTKITSSEFVLIILGVLVSVIFILLFKLTTRIDEKGIHYQFFPFHFSMKLISWKEITKAGIRTYYPISEFGGWGLRGGFFFNKGKEKAVNVSGNIGIQLVLKNREKLLIGTQKKEEAKRVLKTYSEELVKA